MAFASVDGWVFNAEIGGSYPKTDDKDWKNSDLFGKCYLISGRTDLAI